MAFTFSGDTIAGSSVLTEEKWIAGFEAALYEGMKFIPTIKEYPAGKAKQHVRKLGTVTPSTLATNNDGTDVTVQSLSPTEATMIPVWPFLIVGWPDSLEYETDPGLAAAARENITGSMAAYLDYLALQNMASAANGIGNAAQAYDTAVHRLALATLRQNAKDKGQVGDVTINMILPATQLDDALSIGEIMHADVRGDGTAPVVTGKVTKGYGTRYNFTTLCYDDGVSGAVGGLYLDTAFGYFFNQRPTVEKQRYLAQNRYFTQAHFASNIIHTQRAYFVKLNPNL